jgi:hypothetical protein
MKNLSYLVIIWGLQVILPLYRDVQDILEKKRGRRQDEQAWQLVLPVRLLPLPPMLTGVVSTALMVCDKTEYSVQGPCESCGGNLSGYDSRKKRFAVLCEDGKETTIVVIIHRAYCRSCGKIAVPEEPFYHGTRFGSPVVDLCRTLAETIPYSRVATRLGQMGIIIDRGSVRSYCHAPFFPPPSIVVFGMKIPVSIISLSSLAGKLGDTDRISGDDILAACQYPSRNKPVPDTSGPERSRGP